MIGFRLRGTVVAALLWRTALAADDVSMGAADLAYYRQSESLLRSILAGDSPAGKLAASQLASLDQPGSVALADVHSTIAAAYGEVRNFEEGIAHVAKALAVPKADLPSGLAAALVRETLAYGVYFHAALAQFDEAGRLFAMLDAPPPWLFAKLATVYADLEQHDCAVANADAALQAVRDGGTVAPRWAARHTDAIEGRGTVIRDWTEQRLKLLQQSTGTKPADAPTACIGGRRR